MITKILMPHFYFVSLPRYVRYTYIYLFRVQVKEDVWDEGNNIKVRQVRHLYCPTECSRICWNNSIEMNFKYVHYILIIIFSRVKSRSLWRLEEAMQPFMTLETELFGLRRLYIFHWMKSKHLYILLNDIIFSTKLSIKLKWNQLQISIIITLASCRNKNCEAVVAIIVLLL